MEKTKLTAKQYSMVALGLFLLAFVAAVFYVKPSWDELQSLKAGRDEYSQQKDQLNTRLTSLQQIANQLQSSSEIAKETTLSQIPENFDQDKLILDLNNVAKSNDVVLNNVSFSVPTSAKKGEVNKVGISASLTGSESELISFLKAVEGNTRKITVKSIAVQIGKSQDISMVNFNLSMETYFQGK